MATIRSLSLPLLTSAASPDANADAQPQHQLLESSIQPNLPLNAASHFLPSVSSTALSTSPGHTPITSPSHQREMPRIELESDHDPSDSSLELYAPPPPLVSPSSLHIRDTTVATGTGRSPARGRPSASEMLFFFVCLGQWN
jgi:hypothetical protein